MRIKKYQNAPGPLQNGWQPLSNEELVTKKRTPLLARVMRAVESAASKYIFPIVTGYPKEDYARKTYITKHGYDQDYGRDSYFMSRKNQRKYLEDNGYIYTDDDYGLVKTATKRLEKALHKKIPSYQINPDDISRDKLLHVANILNTDNNWTDQKPENKFPDPETFPEALYLGPDGTPYVKSWDLLNYGDGDVAEEKKVRTLEKKSKDYLPFYDRVNNWVAALFGDEYSKELLYKHKRTRASHRFGNGWTYKQFQPLANGLDRLGSPIVLTTGYKRANTKHYSHRFEDAVHKIDPYLNYVPEIDKFSYTIEPAVITANKQGGILKRVESGKSGIHIKPENRGKFTALKKRTGKSSTWYKEHGTPAQKKMAVFALNAKKWKHK